MDQEAYACDVAIRPVEAGYYTSFDRIRAHDEDYRNGRCCRFGRERRRKPACGGDDGNLAANQIGGQRRQPIVLSVRPAVFERYVPALDESVFVDATAKIGRASCRERV